MQVPPQPTAEQLQPFAPAAERTLMLFGAPVSLALLPQRSGRADRPGNARPAFRPGPAARILANECLWSDGVHALTPNRFPFARQQILLWPHQPMREPDRTMWSTIASYLERHGGTALINTIGAAASIAHAHAHLTPEQLPFLDALPTIAGPSDLLPLPSSVEILAKDLPCCLLGLRGPAAALGMALSQLAALRLVPAWNVVMSAATAWVLPRRAEVPGSGFSQALGAAELWGRWCFLDAQEFAAATPDGLEQALLAAATPSLPR